MANDQRTRRSGRAKIVGAALLCWVVVIVVGAGTRSEDTALLGVDNLNVVFIALYLAMALVGLILLIVLNPFSRQWTEPKPRRKQRGAIVLFVLVLLVWRPDLLDGLRSDETAAQVSAGLAVQEVPDTEPPAEPVAQATDLLLLLAIIGLATGVWLWVRRVNPAPLSLSDDTDQLLRAELANAIDQAGFELATGEDPRTAVLNAYALLEAVLGSRGDRRRPAETAAEHIARVLRTIRIDPQPLIRLGDLYEVARFSRRTITIADQTEAAQALEVTRRDLAALT